MFPNGDKQFCSDFDSPIFVHPTHSICFRILEAWVQNKSGREEKKRCNNLENIGKIG